MLFYLLTEGSCLPNNLKFGLFSTKESAYKNICCVKLWAFAFEIYFPYQSHIAFTTAGI